MDILKVKQNGEWVGIPAITGPQGPKGDVGATGATGPKGDKGDTGAQGAKGDPGDDYVLTAADKAEIAQEAEELLAPALDSKAPVVYNTASGAIASFTDGADDLPLRECIVQIEPAQSGSGDPSPENVRPITGWTGAKVSRTGKNLFPQKTVTLGKPGLRTASIYFAEPIKPGSYIFSYSRSGTYIGTGFGVQCFNGFTNVGNVNNDTGMLTVSKEAERMYFYFPQSSYDNDETLIFDNIQLELGSTATDYEPYQGVTYDITFPTEAGTVYGGTLDLVSGVLTVDRALYVPTGSEANYTQQTGRIAFALPAEYRVVGTTERKCSDFLVVTASTYCYITTDMSVDELQAYFQQNTVQIVAGLATPITYALTLHEIRTLLGTNNIWADTGDTSVEYCADTKAYVDESLPDVPVQDVQVNGTSVLSNGVANVPIATANSLGVSRPGSSLNIGASGALEFRAVGASEVKAGTSYLRALTPERQHASVFYGLAKAAGADMASSSNAIGNYTESAKSAISEMLGGSVAVSGTTPTIAAKAGIRYVCGEVSTLDFTPSATGICDVVFTSGTTPAVLTVPNTVKWPAWFNPSSLAANTVYEINILNGVYGAVMAWT